jgi:hypothetical protein
MFTRKELLSFSGPVASMDAGSLNILRFAPKDFKNSSGEETLSIYRLSRNGTDGIQFWLNVISTEAGGQATFFESLLEKSLCNIISESEFKSAIADPVASLKTQAPLMLSGRFVAGMKMHSEWNFVSYLCESTEELFAVFWQTTA